MRINRRTVTSDTRLLWRKRLVKSDSGAAEHTGILITDNRVGTNSKGDRNCITDNGVDMRDAGTYWSEFVCFDKWNW